MQPDRRKTTKISDAARPYKSQISENIWGQAQSHNAQAEWLYKLNIDVEALNAVLRKLIDKATMTDSRYKEAFNMVPYSWLKEHLKLVNVNKVVTTFLSNSMEKRKTVLECEHKTLPGVNIRRGIF